MPPISGLTLIKQQLILRFYDKFQGDFSKLSESYHSAITGSDLLGTPGSLGSLHTQSLNMCDCHNVYERLHSNRERGHGVNYSITRRGMLADSTVVSLYEATYLRVD